MKRNHSNPDINGPPDTKAAINTGCHNNRPTDFDNIKLDAGAVN